jgi:UDP-3-O-[3-hydroxymyristoyl] glucosamine N-acyltransferase
VVIGNHNIIKEFVTINRSTVSDIGVTVLGDRNLIMAYCHIAHNCKLGNHVIMANATNLAGHIHVEDWAIIGGMSGSTNSSASAPTPSSEEPPPWPRTYRRSSPSRATGPVPMG